MLGDLVWWGLENPLVLAQLARRGLWTLRVPGPHSRTSGKKSGHVGQEPERPVVSSLVLPLPGVHCSVLGLCLHFKVVGKVLHPSPCVNS
jgi:hypothetical protein